LNVLQQHYVETLGRAIIVNLPILLTFFYKGISPFLDPVTRDKMRFNPDLFELIPKSQLDADFGGDHTLVFDSESYWNQIMAACGIAADGTRVDFSPKSNLKTEHLDKENASENEMGEEFRPPFSDEKALIEVVSEVKSDNINTLLPRIVP